MGADELVLGIDQQLHRHLDPPVAKRAGQSGQEIRAVDPQTVGGVGDEAGTLVTPAQRDARGDQVPVDQAGQEGPHRSRSEHRYREGEHVAEMGGLGQGAGDPPRPVRPCQTFADVAAQVSWIGSGDRGVGGNHVGRLHPGDVLPQGGRSPVVRDDVHAGARAHRRDDRREVVGQGGEVVSADIGGDPRRTGAPVVVPDDAVLAGQRCNHAVPQHVGVRPAVHQHDRRPVGVALFVDRKLGSVSGGDVAGRHPSIIAGRSDD